MSKNKTCIYRHVRLDTDETFYIGIGKISRANDKFLRSKWWKKIIAKTEYRIDILFENLSWEQACELEKSLIFLYGRRDLNKGSLVNMTNGGEGTPGIKRSKEAMEKTRLFHLGRKRSLKHRELLRQSHLGLKRSKESCLKQSLTNTGRSLPGKLILDYNTGIFYLSIREASKAFNISQSTLYKRLQGYLINNTSLNYV